MEIQSNSDLARSEPALLSCALHHVQGADLGPTMLISLSPWQFEPGYRGGFKQPTLHTTLRLTRSSVARTALEQLAGALAVLGAAGKGLRSGRIRGDAALAHPVLQPVLTFAETALHVLGMPFMSGIEARPAPAGQRDQWDIILPAVHQHNPAPAACFAFAVELVNRCDAGEHIARSNLQGSIDKLLSRYRRLAPRGINSLPFLQAAHDLDIPWQHVCDNIYQFGWGSRSRWLDSSFTDRTSVLSSAVARSKPYCSAVLAKAGLPVPAHHIVGTAAEAVRAAKAIGFPVVIKPADRDGGSGVVVGLHSPQDVEAAFAFAVRFSPTLLVERFHDGADHRLRVCNGVVLNAILREPASVVGNGHDTIEALIHQSNEQRLRTLPADTDAHELKPISVDQDVHMWLKAQQLSVASIPAAGCKIRLRGAANTNLGGTTRDVTALAHPDNLALAVKAARVLRLDLAGVDLLIADIARSWKESPAVICEVNAQPQFSDDRVHPVILRRIVPGNGRIPVVAMIDHGGLAYDLAVLLPSLDRRGIRASTVYTFGACRAALLDPETQLLLWIIDRAQAAQDRAPFDRVDIWVGQADGLSATVAGLHASASQRWNMVGKTDECEALGQQIAQIFERGGA